MQRELSIFLGLLDLDLISHLHHYQRCSLRGLIQLHAGYPLVLAPPAATLTSGA